MSTGKSIDLDELVGPGDTLALEIAEKYVSWNNSRTRRVNEWKEIQEYVFSTSTATTKNSVLPWSNKTTIPKLCQIRDNLFANYMAALFPKRLWLEWESDTEENETADKRNTIKNYMNWVTDRNQFYSEIQKIVYDYIDYGDAFVMPEWKDNTTEEREGYQGPVARRISPLDIVFNPIAEDFENSPKIIRSLISMGDLKEMLTRDSIAAQTPEEQQAIQEIFNTIKKRRLEVANYQDHIDIRDDLYAIAGFSSYHSYLCSDTVEVLTFYGDIYDEENDTYLRNQIVKVVDRAVVAGKWSNPSIFGTSPIYHVGWRRRPDSLWSMGPLDNLVGMQYRIDHLENMKADVFDVIAYPPLKVKGDVSDFEWRPMERIYVGDQGDVAMLVPDTNALQADTQIAILESKMEEMAGSPKEAMGFRTPGEKTAYEVQRLELAAGRIFQSKIAQFERDLLEPLINAMLELARRYMSATTIRVLDENGLAVFANLTAQDISGAGRIRPVAARNFAEKATIVQNLTNFFASAAGQDPQVRLHFSGLEMAKMWNRILDLESYDIIEPYIQLIEQADAQRLANSVQQQVAQEALTPGGIIPGDDTAQ